MNPTDTQEDHQPWLTDTEHLLQKEGYLNEDDITRRLASIEADAFGKLLPGYSVTFSTGPVCCVKYVSTHNAGLVISLIKLREALRKIGTDVSMFQNPGIARTTTTQEYVLVYTAKLVSGVSVSFLLRESETPIVDKKD